MEPSDTFPCGTVTLLFTDIEGSTRLLQHLGEDYARVLADCRHLLRTAFVQYNGHEVDTQGDAFFVAFARATDAVAAAAAIQVALARHPWPEGVAVRVRVGLHTGEPELSSEGYVGLDVHWAARIMSAGHGGQVLLSQTTRDLVEHRLPDDVHLLDLGEHRLKDISYPCRLFQLVISGLPADFPPLKTLGSRFNNLPTPLTALIGREKELAMVCAQLQRPGVRLVTLLGPAGIGKTRLSLQVATQIEANFAHGVCFVPLAPISNPAMVIPTIAQALGLWQAGDHPLLEQVQASLRDKHLLLLLDNFEQVVSAASQLAGLLANCPHLHLLVTSQIPLHISGEHEFVMSPLAVPDLEHLPELVTLSQYEAVRLFIERAQAVKPDFQVTSANAPAVAAICAQLDGLPLAIELASARIKLLPPQALLKRLEHRLEMLKGGMHNLPAQHQTLRNAIQWSYDLLRSEERRLFRWLSVFVGSCTVEAAEAVYNAGTEQAMDVLEGITSLLDKSLLQQTVQGGEEPRLLMLETIREYGLECLVANEELEVAQRAHATYYLALAEEAEPHLMRAAGIQRRPRNRRNLSEEARPHLVDAEQVVWLERLKPEFENLRAALQWSAAHGNDDMNLTLRLSSGLLAFWIWAEAPE